MSLNDILTTDTGRKQRRRVGRGIGSGLGKTAGRGSKGEGSRTGGKNRGPLFEGGQFPFWQRLPRRGFSNVNHATVYQPVRLERALAHISGDLITAEALVAAGLVRDNQLPKLVSGNGVSIKRKITVTVKSTASVRSVIEAAGGSISE